MKRLMVAMVLLLVVARSSSLLAETPSVSIVSPKAGTACGLVAMEAKLDGPLPDGGGVRFLLDDKPLCGPILQAPFTLNWHTVNVWDGDTVLRAVVVDGKGEIVTKSQPVALRIDNGFSGRITVSGVDLTQPLTGVVKLNIHAERVMTDANREENKAVGESPDKSIEAILVFVDGVQQALNFGSADIEVEIDTARFPNGPHELFIWAVAYKKGNPPCAMLRRTITTENKTPEVVHQPRFSRVFLAPGESIDLTPVVRTTVKAFSAVVNLGAPADPAVAVEVKDKPFHIKAVAPGITTVRLIGKQTDGTGERTITIIVDKPHGFPHFGRDGSLLSEYDPKKSLWVRTMFGLSGAELDRVPGLPAAVRHAGFNVLSEGFYYNPADGDSKDFDHWHQGWLNRWNANMAWSEKYDMPLLLHGDDIARTANELNGSLNHPWGPKALRTAFEAATESKRVVAIEMIDEVSFLWGNTPTPTDGRWQKQTPPLPDDAFIKLMAIIDSVKNRPAITWPIGGISGPDCAATWMGDPRFSNYATLYWDVLAWRRAYNDGASHPQELDALRRCVDDRLPVLQRDKPMLLLVSGCGPFYEKRGDEGTQFIPGRDVTHGFPGQPATPSNSTLLMYAPAAGMAGVRIYHFDHEHWKYQRAHAKTGDGGLQTGAEPFEVGTDRWLSIAAALRLIENLEPYMLLPQTHAPYLGEGIFTGARKGKDGEMVIAINFTNSVRTIDDLPLPSETVHDRILARGGSNSERDAGMRNVYRVHGMTLRVERHFPGSRLTLQPGEAVVCVAPVKDGKLQPDKNRMTCAFVAPLADAHVRGSVPIVVSARTVSNNPVTVEIFADGVALEVKKTARGFEAVWDATSAKPNVWHGLTAIATDHVGAKTEARTAVFVRE